MGKNKYAIPKWIESLVYDLDDEIDKNSPDLKGVEGGFRTIDIAYDMETGVATLNPQYGYRNGKSEYYLEYYYEIGRKDGQVIAGQRDSRSLLETLIPWKVAAYYHIDGKTIPMLHITKHNIGLADEFATIEGFWDCNCEGDWVKHPFVRKCEQCGTDSVDGGDADLNYVLSLRDLSEEEEIGLIMALDELKGS